MLRGCSTHQVDPIPSEVVNKHNNDVWRLAVVSAQGRQSGNWGGPKELSYQHARQQHALENGAVAAVIGTGSHTKNRVKSSIGGGGGNCLTESYTHIRTN